jgi:hypothetical protein
MNAKIMTVLLVVKLLEWMLHCTPQLKQSVIHAMHMSTLTKERQLKMPTVIVFFKILFLLQIAYKTTMMKLVDV